MANANITKNAIRQAFLDILSEKPLNKITVRDISERCGINRNTFYYHYQDIPSLLEEVCEIETCRIIEKYPELNSIEQCAMAAMEFALEHKRAVMHIYNSTNNSAYINSLWKVCEYVVTEYVDTVFPDAPLSEYDRTIWIRFLKSTLFGLTNEWIINGMKDDDIEAMQRVFLQTKGVSDMIIRNCQDLSAAEENTAAVPVISVSEEH